MYDAEYLLKEEEEVETILIKVLKLNGR